MCSTAAKRKWKCLRNVDVLKRKTYLILIYSKKVSCSIIRVLILKTSSLVFNVTLGFVLTIFTVFFLLRICTERSSLCGLQFCTRSSHKLSEKLRNSFSDGLKINDSVLGLALMKHLEPKKASEVIYGNAQ